MSITQTSDPEWAELYDIFCDLPYDIRGPVTDTYYKNSRGALPVAAMRYALQHHGCLKRSLSNNGAEEYEEIMKGDEIWERIHHV